jgi:RNA polymerase sigma-70 factor, ECF subfamily
MTPLSPEQRERFCAGDREILGLLAETLGPSLLRIGRRLLFSTPEAEDFAQTALIHVYEQRAKYDPKRPFEPWFYRVTVNVARSWRRKKREWLAGDDLPEPGVAPDAEKRLLQEEQKQRVSLVLAKLSPAHREILALRFVSEASLEDIAHALRIPQGTVKSRLSRALQAFHQRFKTEGEDSHAVS